MAITTAFKVTNTTATTLKALGLFDMDEVESYGSAKVSRGTKYTNGTVGFDGDEVITLKSNDFQNMGDCQVSVDNMSSKDVISYGVKLDIEAVTEDSADPHFKYVDPIIVQVMFRHPKSDYITASLIKTALARAVSVLFPEAGTNVRITQLMKGNTTISAD